jgi:tellurite resistance protein TerC
VNGRITTLAQAKRLIKIVFAFTLLIVGVAMLVLPGPGLLVIGAALAILSGEFVWAKRLLERLKAGAHRAQEAVSKRTSSRTSSRS